MQNARPLWFFHSGRALFTGAGMNLIFGIDWKLGSVIMIAVVVYMYFAKNVYKKPTVLRICMTVSYIFAVIMTISGLSTQIPKIIALFA